MIEMLSAASVAKLLPARAPGAHKGHFGHVLVIAGAQGYVGAARLATEAALRSGAGLVTLAVPEPLLDAASNGLSEAMTYPLPAEATGVIAARAAGEAATLANARDAVVLGPGLTTHDGPARFVHGLLAMAPGVPLVLDADALNIVAASAEVFSAVLRARTGTCVITPHPGEAARLLGVSIAEIQADREAAVQRLVQLGAGVVVLKGHKTLIGAADDALAMNTTGGNGLAKGGSGDVLAGLIGGLLAQGMQPFDAARLGVYLHGLAGDLAQAQHSARAMLARDVLASFGPAWKKLEATP
jgi:hydroxyethylthiazole kinase-like uncharacterized protein yjeF